MLNVVPITLFAILTLISAVHVYWAFGGLWPAGDEQGLINTVLGNPHARAMPPLGVTLVVAGLIFLAGVFGLLAGGWIPGVIHVLARIAAGVLALIFIGRGGVGWAIDFGLLHVEVTEPFRTLDLWFYAPLCIALGVGFAVLAATGGELARQG